jgi:transposase
MAKASGLNQTAVSRIWRAFGLKPHLVDTWKLSTDPQFIEKVRDVVGLYMDPPEAAMVLAVDEKSQMQALDRTAPLLPMMPTVPARQTHDYVRHGTTSLFAALDVATGKVIGATHRRHRHQEFLRFLKTIDAATPADLDLHLVLDNYSTHKTPAIHKWLLAHPRFHLHFTPTYLLMAECRGALVRRADQPQAAPLGAPQRPGPGNRREVMDRGLEPRPQTLRVNEDRRRDPHHRRRLLHTN